MNAIVFDRGALWFSVPEGNRPCGSRLEHRLADCLADQLGDAAPRPGGSRAQRLEFFPGEVNLGFFHVCHFVVTTDICQGPVVGQFMKPTTTQARDLRLEALASKAPHYDQRLARQAAVSSRVAEDVAARDGGGSRTGSAVAILHACWQRTRHRARLPPGDRRGRKILVGEKTQNQAALGNTFSELSVSRA